jgi:aspartate-semialdehyde dehydrogenase
MIKRKLIMIGGGYLTVQEILDTISRENLPIDKFQLLSEGERVGEIHDYRNQPLLVSNLDTMMEEGYDAAIVLSPVADLEKLTKALVLNKVPVLDMANRYHASGDLPVLIPDSISYCGQGLPMIGILPTGPAHALATLLHALKEAAPWIRVTLFTLQGVSLLGTRQGMDELFDQTRNIMGFTDIECASFPRQIAFNAFHCSHTKETCAVMESQARDIVRKPELRVVYDGAWCGFFVGILGTVWLESADNISVERVKHDLCKASGIDLKETVEGILAVVGHDTLVVGDVSCVPGSVGCLTLRFAMDNLRRGLATTLAALLKQVWMEN